MRVTQAPDREPWSQAAVIAQIWRLVREIAGPLQSQEVACHALSDTPDSEKDTVEEACAVVGCEPRVRETIMRERTEWFREYDDTPTGEPLNLTNTEFDTVVEVFKTLLRWKKERRSSK